MARFREGKIFVKSMGKAWQASYGTRYVIGYYFYERHKKRRFIPMTRRFHHKDQALNALKRFKRTGHLLRALSWVKKR